MVEKVWQRRFQCTHGMGAVMELRFVNSFTLTKLCDVLQGENVGLNRDDGLVIVKQMSGPKLERKRKKITKTF